MDHFLARLLSFLVPTPLPRGGGGGGGGSTGPRAISKTVVPKNLKFCRVLETSLTF